MRLHSRSRLKTVISLGVLSIGISLVLTPIASAMSLSLQRDMLPRSEIGLEIRLTGESRPLIRLAGPHGGGGMTLILRRLLRINDPNAAGEFTALDVRAEVEADAIKVTLSIIYNDLSNQEWWKDKKEKFAGSYLIRVGETVRPAELDQFGQLAFELLAPVAQGENLALGNRNGAAAVRVGNVELREQIGIILEELRIVLQVARDFVGFHCFSLCNSMRPGAEPSMFRERGTLTPVRSTVAREKAARSRRRTP